MSGHVGGPRGVLAVARLELEQLLVRPLSITLSAIFIVLVAVAGYAGSFIATSSQVGGALEQIVSTVVLAIMAFAVALLGPIVPIANSIDTVSGERVSRTIDLLVSRPVTRRGVMLGKILGRGAHVAVVAVAGVLLGGAVAWGRVPLSLAELALFAGLVALLCVAWVALTALASTMLKGSGGFGIALGIFFGFFVYGIVLGRFGLGGLAALTNPNTLFLGAVQEILPVSENGRQILSNLTTGLPQGLGLVMLPVFTLAVIAVATEVFHRQDEAGG